MKCRTCGYRLWQLPARRCPECGTDYRPSDYEFVPNSVEFHCPHCRQPYYGTGPKGHLAPSEFNCVTCGRHVTMDEMILSPAPGTSEEQTSLRLPWLERRERGWLRAWLSTARIALFAPSQLMKAVPADSSGWEAFRFVFLNLVPVLTIACIPVVIFDVLIMASTMGNAPLFFIVGMLLMTLVSGLLSLVWIALWALLAHALLRLTGQTAGPLLRTQQAIYYSSGANLVTAIPCLGSYVGWIWYLVSAIFAVKEGQRVHGGRATFAVLGPPVIVFLAFAGFFLAVMALARTATFTSLPATTTAAQPQGDTLKVTQAVVNFARKHNGRAPDHAILLVTRGDLFASDFVGSDSMTRLDGIPLGGTTLEHFSFVKLSEQTRFASAAVTGLPKGTVAHRLGDYVFTFHGMDLSTPDPRLWVVVRILDPAANASVPPHLNLTCGMADGTFRSMPASQFPSDLAAQNSVRAELGLPPLPDLRTVTHAQPAVSAPAEASE